MPIMICAAACGVVALSGWRATERGQGARRWRGRRSPPAPAEATRECRREVVVVVLPALDVVVLRAVVTSGVLRGAVRVHATAKTARAIAAVVGL